MKKLLSLLLSVTLCVSAFVLPASAKAVDTGLIINGSTKNLTTHIEYANDIYYVSVQELSNDGFTYSITNDCYVLTRYGTELKIDKKGDTVYKNGSSSSFENAVILPSVQNGSFYIAADLLKNCFCSSATINSSAVNLTLSAFSSTVSKTVSGKISLASGTATSDMEYSVDVIGSDTFSAKVTIPSGSSSVTYSVPVYSADTNFIIRCRQLNSASVSGFASVCYYSYKETVTSPLDASSVGIATNAVANITVPSSITVTGDISGIGDGYLIVENSAGDVLGSSEFYSSSSTGYSVTLPGNTNDAYIRYKIYSGDGIVRYGYYTNNGTSGFKSDAAVQSISLNSVFNMEILTGKTISGTFNWNNSDASYCTVRAMTLDGKYITDANVYTKDTDTFGIVVPSDEYTEYLLVVNTDDSSFAKYASSTGLTTARADAIVYNVADGNISDASITVDENAKVRALYGRLILPDGLTATSDMSVTLYAGALTKNASVENGAYSIAKTYTTSVVIPAGKSSVDYSINLGTSYNGEKIALGYVSGVSSVANGYFDGYNKTLFSTDKDISFNAEKINNIDLYVVTDSPVDITSVKDSNGNDFTASSANKSDVVVTAENLTNIDREVTLFVGAYDATNTLISSGYVTFTAEGSSSKAVTVNMFGDAETAKFLKILTIDQNGWLVARDIVIL